MAFASKQKKPFATTLFESTPCPRKPTPPPKKRTGSSSPMAQKRNCCGCYEWLTKAPLPRDKVKHDQNQGLSESPLRHQATPRPSGPEAALYWDPCRSLQVWQDRCLDFNDSGSIQRLLREDLRVQPLD